MLHEGTAPSREESPFCRPRVHAGRIGVALGIVAFALIGLVGLIAVGLESERNSIATVAASNIATAILTELRETRGIEALDFEEPLGGWQPGAVSSVTQIGPAFLSVGGQNVTASEATFRCTGTLTLPSELQLPVATISLLISWPAQADPSDAKGVFEVTSVVPLSE